MKPDLHHHFHHHMVTLLHFFCKICLYNSITIQQYCFFFMCNPEKMNQNQQQQNDPETQKFSRNLRALLLPHLLHASLQCPPSSSPASRLLTYTLPPRQIHHPHHDTIVSSSQIH